MKAVGRTSAGTVLALVALLLSYAASAGTPAFAQYEVPADQYGAPAEDQYATPPVDPAPLPEERTVEEETTGGVTAPAGDGNDDNSEREGGAAESAPKDRSPSDAAAKNLARLSDGFLVEAVALFVVLSLITTLFFFLERSSEHRRA